MKVADAVRGPVRVVRADTPLPIVAAELAAQAGGAVPVVDTAGNLVGLLTAAGLAHAGEGRVEEINPEDVVAAVMTHRPATVGMDDPGGRRGGRGARPGRRCGRRRRRRPGGRRANPPRAGGPRGRRRFRHQAGTEYGLRAVAEAGRRPGSISISLPAFADSTEPVSTTRVDNRCRMPWLHPLALGWVVEAEARAATVNPPSRSGPSTMTAAAARAGSITRWATGRRASSSVAPASSSVRISAVASNHRCRSRVCSYRSAFWVAIPAAATSASTTTSRRR